MCVRRQTREHEPRTCSVRQGWPTPLLALTSTLQDKDQDCADCVANGQQYCKNDVNLVRRSTAGAQPSFNTSQRLPGRHGLQDSRTQCPMYWPKASSAVIWDEKGVVALRLNGASRAACRGGGYARAQAGISSGQWRPCGAALI